MQLVIYGRNLRYAANAAIFTTNKPPGYTVALDVVARIEGGVVVVASRKIRLEPSRLEVAGGVGAVTREGNLWRPAREHVQGFPVYGIG